jgi:hypothetical protein
MAISVSSASTSTSPKLERRISTTELLQSLVRALSSDSNDCIIDVTKPSDFMFVKKLGSG